MKLTKEVLEDLYNSMSLDEIATHLNMSKSTLYYQMKKMGIVCRNKSDAQRKHIQTSGHQRQGKYHSDDVKEKISHSTKEFWDSERGKRQKSLLSTLRKHEWQNSSAGEKLLILDRLQYADRPKPGELSNFGKKLAEFLSAYETVSTGIKLTNGHISDIILEERKIVIELIFPISIYGEVQKQRLQDRYNRLQNELIAAGYRVFIIEDKSNSISKARCRRVYNELCSFFNDTSKTKSIIS